MPLRQTLACIPFLLTVSGVAGADVLVLDNGDRLTGSLVRADETRLEFRPEHSETAVRVRWERIEMLETDEPIYLRLHDGSEVVGRAVETEPGRIRLISVDLDEPLDIRVASIRGIGTSPEEVPSIVRTTGNIAFGGSLTRGNTETEAYNANADFEARTDVNRLRLHAEGNRAKDDGDLSRENARGGMRYDHFVTERLYLNSNLSLATDRFRDLRLRTTVGGGLGYQFFETETRRLSTEAGLSYINEEFREAENDGRGAARWALDYEERLFGDTLRFFYNHEALQGFEQSDDFLLFVRTGLRFPLVLGMTGTAQVNLDYDRSPPEGNTTTDTAYLLTIGYSW